MFYTGNKHDYIISTLSYPEKLFYNTYKGFKEGTDDYLSKAIGFDPFFELQLQIPIQIKQIKMVVDFYQPDTKIAVEIDGFEWHSDKNTFTKDRLKSNILQRHGYISLRYPAAIIIKEPQDCLVEIYKTYCERIANGKTT